MSLKTIQTMQDAIDIIEEIGFLPLFNNAMPGYGFSVEELCAREVVCRRRRPVGVEGSHRPADWRWLRNHGAWRQPRTLGATAIQPART